MQSRWVTSRCDCGAEPLTGTPNLERCIGRMPWQTIFSVTLQGKEKSSGMSITSHPFPEQSRGVQTQTTFVKYVSLHFYLSLSSSRRMARIVMDSGEGMWDKRVVADWDGHGSKMKEK